MNSAIKWAAAVLIAVLITLSSIVGIWMLTL